MHGSSDSQFFRTSTEIQSGTDAFDEEDLTPLEIREKGHISLGDQQSSFFLFIIFTVDLYTYFSNA